MKHTCVYSHRREVGSAPPAAGFGGVTLVAGSPVMFEGELRMEEQVPGREFGDAAESGRRRQGCGVWAEPSGS